MFTAFVVSIVAEGAKPRFVLAPAAVFAPVPPFAKATTPVTFDAVPVVFWFSVGTSEA